jgi:hypothetical protein
VAESWVHDAVCRQRPELWLRVGYMMLCGQRPELWPRVFLEVMFIPLLELFVIVDYINQCVDRSLKCGQILVPLFLTVFKCRDIILSHRPLSFNPPYKTNTVAISEMTASNANFVANFIKSLEIFTLC